MAKLQVICKAMFIIVWTLFSSTLINFQGSVSAKYLFPKRAKFIISESASLNLKFSIATEILSGKAASCSKINKSSLV